MTDRDVVWLRPHCWRLVAVFGAVLAGFAYSAHAQDRSFDGTGNNLGAAVWGSVGQPMLRFGVPAYSDGMNGMAGASRPGAREISNAIFSQSASMPNANGLTDWVWQWGQFVDHDITFTPVGSESAPIMVPMDDPVFTGGSMIAFTRSEPMAGTGTDPANPRQQSNGITAWIDASNVYGSSASRANSLRTMSGGKLTLVAHATGQLLPKDGGGQFMAGDVRAGEQVALTSTHTLFARQHNAWTDALSGAGFSADDETLYQAARKIVGAQMQIITYSEWLPHMIDAGQMPAYAGYDDTVNPTISNEFASSLFRFGHTMLPSQLQRMNSDGSSIAGGSIALRDSFFNPSAIENGGGISPLLKGLASQAMQTVDTKMVDDIRNFLFGGGGTGFDLAALNIQRGRDHGLADYNTMREAYGLAKVTTFAQITSDVALQSELAAMYSSVDDIDSWVGALAEEHAPGAAVGALVQASMVDQFSRLRDGDRFWYQNDADLASILAALEMTVEDLEGIKLSDVIRSVGGVTNIQDNVFLIPSPGPGILVMAFGVVFVRRRR